MMGTTENRVLALTAQLCDQSITAAQFAELDQLLASDRAARDTYRGFLSLHQRLEGGLLEVGPAAEVTRLFAVPDATGDRKPEETPHQPTPWGDLERRLRKAEKRWIWSLAACLLAALFLFQFVFRAKPGNDPEALRSAIVLPPPEEAGDREPETDSGTTKDAAGSLADQTFPASPPTPEPPPAPVPPTPPIAATDGQDQIEESKGGFLIREAAINDVFQMLAKRAGKQYFHNTRISGPEFKVSGQLQGDDPDQQMEELAFMHGLQLYRKGDTVYALHEEQLKQLPTEKVSYPLRAIAPGQAEEIKEVIKPMLSPTGVASYDPESRSLTIEDSSHQVARAWEFLADLDLDLGPDVQAGAGSNDYGNVPVEFDPSSVPDAEVQLLTMIDRVPIVTTAINETEVSNQLTEEVRYQVDTKDPVGDPATTREIGVTVEVTPTLLPDGTIRIKMRPRSAQSVEEVISQSGTRYTEPSESMLESVARVPSGHSLVLGGFYGEVKQKEESKVPLLGDIPAINFFFKNQETIEEPLSLLFVATPTRFGSQVAVETKILDVHPKATERTGVDWTSSLNGNIPVETIGSLNSLFGINEDASAKAVSDGSIVLSPTQVKKLLRTLDESGLTTQISNPTMISDRQLVPDPRNNLELDAREVPFSTFSLHVSDVSFKLARAALALGKWPKPRQIRVEEFVNAFDYGDPSPNQQQKIACRLEQAAHPFLEQRNLLRISMKTASLGRSASTPLRLTVLLDSSGSMDRVDRAESVKTAFRLLADQLTPADQVTLIGFARTPRLLADRLPGDRVAELADRMDTMPIEGGTNLEQALALGLEKAREFKLEGGQNRIILLTDGAANLGNADPEDLARLVEEMRGQGIAFDACGVGADGLNDEILESLTRKGDGRYYFLDRPEDADEGFAKQIAGALRPAARNVKVQVNFNPERVGRYKLYGFAKHLLQEEDFRNDSVDAAELAAEEAGNAVYHFEVLPEGHGEIGTVSVRFQDPDSGRMVEREWTIPYEPDAPRLEEAAASLRLAASAALLAELLMGSPIGESVELEPLAKLIHGLGSDPPSQRLIRDLGEMVNQVREQLGR